MINDKLQSLYNIKDTIEFINQIEATQLDYPQIVNWPHTQTYHMKKESKVLCIFLKLIQKAIDTQNNPIQTS